MICTSVSASRDTRYSWTQLKVPTTVGMLGTCSSQCQEAQRGDTPPPPALILLLSRGWDKAPETLLFLLVPTLLLSGSGQPSPSTVASLATPSPPREGYKAGTSLAPCTWGPPSPVCFSTDLFLPLWELLVSRKSMCVLGTCSPQLPLEAGTQHNQGCSPSGSLPCAQRRDTVSSLAPFQREMGRGQHHVSQVGAGKGFQSIHAGKIRWHRWQSTGRWWGGCYGHSQGLA